MRSEAALKRPSRAVVPAVFILLLAVLTLAAHVMTLDTDSTLERDLLNSLHAPGFALLAAGILIALRIVLKAPRAYATTAALCVGIGLVSEIVQYFGPRDAELIDLVSDVIGTAGALLLAAAADKKIHIRFRSMPRRIALLIVAAGLLSIAMLPTARLSQTILQRNEAMPMLLDFETAWQNELYRAYGGATIDLLSKPDKWPSRGHTVAVVRTGTWDYTGIVIEPYSAWIGYDSFSFLASSLNGETQEWDLRIDDKDNNGSFSDRFNTTVQIDASPQRISLLLDDVRKAPANRQMDMKTITRISLFRRGSDEPSAILLDDLRLGMVHHSRPVRTGR